MATPGVPPVAMVAPSPYPPIARVVQEPDAQQQQQRLDGKWSSDLCDCAKDGETCWWSFWCPLLVFARTSTRFELTPSSCGLVIQLVALSVLGLSLTVIVGPIAGIAATVALATWRAVYRARLRAKLGIQGGCCEDFGVHLCCGPCAVAQEARHAKHLGLPPIEFCTGEPLPASLSLDPSADGPSFWAQLGSVSKCAKLILVACLGLFIAASVVSAKEPSTILILILALVEPAVILWLVYWRKHRKEASLDVVIKLFAVGFFWTSQFAAMTEPVIEMVLVTIGSLLGLMPSIDPDVLIEGGDGIGDPNDPNAALEAQMRLWARKNFVVVILALFCMAFVVAAGVEELFKYLSVRYCSLGHQPRNPNTILIYLVTAAAGFASAENIAYVFGFKSTMQGVSVLAGELYVLGLRALMPLHVICAGQQAIQVVKDLTRDAPTPIWRLLLPAWVLHGTFDFLLMLLAALQFAFEVDEAALNIASLIIGLGITVLSLLVTVRMWRQQQESLGWERVDEIEINLGAGPDEGVHRRDSLLATSPSAESV